DRTEDGPAGGRPAETPGGPRLRPARPEDDGLTLPQPDRALPRRKRPARLRAVEAGDRVVEGQRRDDRRLGRRAEDAAPAAPLPGVTRPGGSRAGLQAARAAVPRTARRAGR